MDERIAGEDFSKYLEPTYFIESKADGIVSIANDLTKGLDEKEASVTLFNYVRDHIKYDPYCALDPPEMYRATKVLARGRGFCVQKAVLLAALARAANIPTRLGFADVKNHKTPEKLYKAMGTNVFVFHGYVEFFLKGRWIKATPAFDSETTEKAGAVLVEMDGETDAIFHPVDPKGQPHMEYLRYRGVYADLPMKDIIKAFQSEYGDRSPALPSTSGHSGSGA